MNGSCLCGAVTFEVKGEVPPPAICHCGQCRRQSGHVWASSSVEEDAIAIVGDVRWFEASPTAKRGFCPVCGSFLFWKAHDESTFSFSMGSIDGPTGVSLGRHIFTADKGDYYAISDGVPKT